MFLFGSGKALLTSEVNRSSCFQYRIGLARHQSNPHVSWVPRGALPARKIRLSARDAKPVGHRPVSLTNREWHLDPAVNTEGLRPHWRTRASTLCRILLRLHFPPPAEPIDHQPDQERGLLRSNNNVAAHGLESAPQLKNRGLPLCNFAANT